MNPTIAQKNRRILVIDDNPSIHADFRKILADARPADAALASAEAALFGNPAEVKAQATFEIDSAFQGEEGLQMVQQACAAGRPYALAFVDVRMPPGWDGIETISRIWAIHPQLQIVICTAYSDYSWEEIIRKIGVSDSLLILKKPFDNVEVLQLAHALTEKWFLAQQASLRFEDLDRMVGQRTHELQAANAKLQQQMQERELAEQALRLSEERFGKAFRASPIPLAIQTLADERYLDVNDSFLNMLGFERGEVIDHTADDLQLWPDPAARAKVREALLAGRSLRNHECQLRAKSGDLHSALLSVESFALGAVPCVMVITQDVTEQMQLERQLRQAQKMEAVGQLAAGVAHDFNNILTIIQGHVCLRLYTPGLDQEMRESLQQVSLAAERAATLTRQLLAFSRKQMMQTRTLHLNEVIGQLSNMLGRLIGEHIRFTCDYAEGLPAIRADVSGIEQILMNLVVNARDAMPQSGTLTLATSLAHIDDAYARLNSEATPGRYVCVSVTDTGCGMSPATQAKIFEPFFTTKDVGKGTGLGLATVYGIVKQHRGWVEVESAPGRGTTFKIFFPANGVASPPASPSLNGVPEVVGGKETLLVVEDDSAVRDLAKTILEGYGYEVLVADNGPHALRLWEQEQNRVSLLLTDMVMPEGLSGRDLAERMKARRPNLKVIYSSGYSAELMGDGLKLREGLNFVPKPYQPDQLARSVRECLDL